MGGWGQSTSERLGGNFYNAGCNALSVGALFVMITHTEPTLVFVFHRNRALVFSISIVKY